MASFGLYVHIPYCDSKCPYCDFNSYAVPRWPEADYTAALCRELRTRAADPVWAGRTVASVFFGGGTPSLFDPDSIGAILGCAGDLWPLAADVEITLEANPGTVDEARLAGFRAAGINRLSFGVQSFHERHLRTLGRIHSAGQAEDALGLARAAGFTDVNLDLIFALPDQRMDEWRADLERACLQGTTHISAYNLTYEEGTAFFRWRAERRLVPLDEDSEFEMFQLTRSFLAERGFAAYEISNFALPGHACRHNLNYWQGGDYLGVGAGAHSFVRGAQARWGRRWANRKSPVAYLQGVANDGLAEASSELPDARQAAGEFVFLNLRCTDGMPLDAFRERFDVSFAELFPHVEELERDGLLVCDRDRVRLSPAGLLVADSIFAGFL
jgi:oxygen-independent coproporphyrinogen-3 oxidase